jgi:hypothetical protein
VTILDVEVIPPDHLSTSNISAYIRLSGPMCRLTTVMAKYRDWSIDGKPLGTARGVIDEKNTRTDYTSTESSQDYYFMEFFNTQ